MIIPSARAEAGNRNDTNKRAKVKKVRITFMVPLD
jgi:hypothetical protein